MLLFQERYGRIFLLHLLIRLTVAEGEFGNFANPPSSGPALAYTLGSLVWITWETGLERITLTLFERNRTDFEYLLNSWNISNTGSYYWVVGDVVDDNTYPTTILHKTDISNKRFFFAIYNPGNTTPAIESNSFDVVPAVSSSTSATTSSASVSSSSASTSSIITGTSPASLATTSVLPSPTATVTIYALSQRAKTGIGVGIGLGNPLLFALGIYFGWRFRGGRNTSGSSRATTVDTPFIDTPSIVEAPNFNRPLELPNFHHPMSHEMSDQASRS